MSKFKWNTKYGTSMKKNENIGIVYCPPTTWKHTIASIKGTAYELWLLFMMAACFAAVINPHEVINLILLLLNK